LWDVECNPKYKEMAEQVYFIDIASAADKRGRRIVIK
jgi:hypothetical protein